MATIQVNFETTKFRGFYCKHGGDYVGSPWCIWGCLGRFEGTDRERFTCPNIKSMDYVRDKVIFYKKPKVPLP
jgi:hypothetical protein